MPEVDSTQRATDLRTQARKRLEAKRNFKTHVFIYLLVNAVLVGVWAIATRDALFWPIFPILGWGIGLRPMPGRCSCASRSRMPRSSARSDAFAKKGISS